MGLWLQLIGRSAVDTVTTVTIPVAVLLWLLAWLEASGRLEPRRFLSGSGWRQTTYGAALAAIPGCAGGIAVSKMYVEGLVAPAALWAAHIATAGDASFVLLVGKPLQALGIFAFLFVLGTLSGIVVSARRRGVPEPAVRPVLGGEAATQDEPDAGPGVPRLYVTWVVMVVAAVLAAIVANVAGAVVSGIAGVLAVLAVVVSIGVQRGWSWPAGGPAAAGATAAGGAAAGATAAPEASKAPASATPAVRHPAHASGTPAPAAGEVAAAAPVRRGAEVVYSAIRTAVKDASEITLWVAVADLAFYAVQQIWGPQVNLWMNGAVLPVTLISIVVGMIPGCGPQIFLARLYTAGSLPFVAILANSVSQHGDSIFPLLGRRRAQAVRVTVSSTVLALAIGLIAVAATGKL